MLCACSNVNNAVERCEAQHEAVAFECTRKTFFGAFKGSVPIVCAATDKLLKLVHCALLRLLFNVNAKGTIGVPAETIICMCMPRLWMLGIDEHHCDTLLAASCLRGGYQIICTLL